MSSVRFLSFSIIAIFYKDHPSWSLCGGESRTGVLQKLLTLFNMRFSYKHCLRLLSYSSSSFHRNAIAWGKFALRHHLLFFLFPFHFYCVQLVQPPSPHHHHHHHISIVSRTDTSTFDFPPLEGQRFCCLAPPPPPPYVYFRFLLHHHLLIFIVFHSSVFLLIAFF